ncbi:hypothetical protein BDAP_002049 [Binucleata daphniae]
MKCFIIYKISDLKLETLIHTLNKTGTDLLTALFGIQILLKYNTASYLTEKTISGIILNEINTENIIKTINVGYDKKHACIYDTQCVNNNITHTKDLCITLDTANFYDKNDTVKTEYCAAYNKIVCDTNYVQKSKYTINNADMLNRACNTKNVTQKDANSLTSKCITFGANDWLADDSLEYDYNTTFTLELFISSMIIASKVLIDIPVSNYSWSFYSNTSLDKLNLLELKILTKLNFDVDLTKSIYKVIVNKVNEYTCKINK